MDTYLHIPSASANQYPVTCNNDSSGHYRRPCTGSHIFKNYVYPVDSHTISLRITLSLQFMDAFIQLLTDWGYWGMFISAFLAGTILPFSSEAVLLACIGLGLDPVLSTLSTTAGNALGGLTCYWIGHLGKMGWIHKYFKVDQKQLDRAVHFIHGRGSWMALFSFLPVIGDAILIVLGLMRANVWIVCISMTVGKLVRYALLVAATLGIISLF